MRAHLIFIGGTGASCAKAFISAGAVGGSTLAPPGSHITVHTIDPDTDGTAQQAVGTLRGAFKDLQKTLPVAYSCNLETSGKQRRPYEGVGQLPERVTVPSLLGCTPQTGGHRILQLLLDDHQISKDLRHGFYGWPGVGSAIWERWTPEDMPGIDDFGRASAGEELRIILIGSIFGGTGSSGIPTLARRYRAMIDESQGKGNIRLQALVLTPYFKVDPGDLPVGEDLIREQDNKFRTRHVMEDVVAGKHGFDSVFFLGRKDTDQTPFPTDCYSLDSQKNPTTLIERLAAWTLWGHLLSQAPVPEKGTNHVLSINEDGETLAQWDGGTGLQFEKSVERLSALVTFLGVELGDWRAADSFSRVLKAWMSLEYGNQGRHSLEDTHLPIRRLGQLRKVIALLENSEHRLADVENWDVLFKELAGRSRYEILHGAIGPGNLKEALRKWREAPDSAIEALWRELNRN